MVDCMKKQNIQLGQGGFIKETYSLDDFERFSELSEDHNPIHVDPGFSAMSRFGKPVCHGMLLYGMINRVLGTQIPGPGTMQLKQTFTFPYPTYTDEEVTINAWVTDIAGKNVYNMGTIISKPNGNMAAQGETKVFLPENGFESESIEGFGEEQKAENVSYKGLEVGQSEQTTRKFSEEDLKERSDLTGDTNPIFLSKEFAQEVGYETLPIPSDLLGAMISDLLGTDLPGLGTNWLKQEFRFLNPAYIDDKITAKVEITNIRPEKDLVNLRNKCTAPDGTIVLDGRSLVLVKDLKET